MAYSIIQTGPKSKNLTGYVSGRLTAIAPVDRTQQGKILWLCICECGTESIVSVDQLSAARTKSCGCLVKERTIEANTRHGLSHTSEYRAWTHMKDRCNNPNDKGFVHYGGRGIYVCDRWADSFASFIADMGKRPSPKHTIDRIDNDGPYSPENCHWATKREQAYNRRSNRPITFNCETLTVTQWAKRTGLSETTIRSRMGRGLSAKHILTRPHKSKLHLHTRNGVTKPIGEWAKDFSIKIGTVSYRVHRMGWSIDKALTTPLLRKHK